MEGTTYNARAERNGGGLSVLAPHAVVLPSVGISIGVEDGDDGELELVDETGNLFAVTIAENQLLGDVGHNGGSNPLYYTESLPKGAGSEL